MKDINILKQEGIDIDASMQIFGDINLYNETANDFLNVIKERLAKLKEYKEAGDAHNYAILAHSMKSDAKYLGFLELANISLNHELKGKANDLNYIYQEYDNLIKETKRIIEVLAKYLDVDKKKFIPEEKTKRHDATILVVDDAILIQNYVRKIFSNSYNVVIATNGKEAIDILTLHPDINFACILLDLNMPLMSGFDVLEYMQQNSLFVKLPVSIITGEDSKDNINRVFSYPIIEVLSKPFNENDVKRVVEKTIMISKL